ncbi:MAG: sugar ABC transporter substrate-binding protein [Exiguobacterium profundum]|nr:MAG: sugar ABC transporter substrate-binding protein [Exiguobacterium profundum]
MRLLASTAVTLTLCALPALAQTDITFQLWGSPQEGEVWSKVAEAFHAAHPDISVKVEVADWDSYWEKLRVLISGGTPPDVFAMDAPLYPDWQSRGALLNLQPLIDADPAALDGVFPITLEAYKTPEGYFGLPRDFQTIVLYYNKAMFDAAGVAYPTADWTWDDLRGAAKALTLDKDGDGSVDQWGFWAEAYDQEPFWGSVVWSYGGDIVDVPGKTLIGSEAAQSAFEFIRAMWLDDKSMPTQSQLAQYGYDGFLVSVSAMGVSGHWSVPDYAAAGLNFDVAPMPKVAGRATGVNSAGFVISSATKNPEAAWEFVKFATGEVGQTELAKLGFAVPIRESVAASDAYLKQATPINHQLFVDALAYARPKPVFRGYEDWSGAVGDALTLIWEGRSDVADAVAEAVARGDEALAKAAE